MKPQWRLAELQHVLCCRECGEAIGMADMAWFVPPRPVEPGCVTLRPVVHRVCPAKAAS